MNSLRSQWKGIATDLNEAKLAEVCEHIYNDYVMFTLADTKLFGADNKMSLLQKRRSILRDVPKLFRDTLKKNKEMDKVLKGMISVEYNKYKRRYTLKLNVPRSITPVQKIDYKERLERLLYDFGEDGKKLATNLFLYGYFDHDFNFGPTNISTMFSTQFQAAFPEYIDTLRELKAPEATAEQFRDMFWANHPEYIPNMFHYVSEKIAQQGPQTVVIGSDKDSSVGPWALKNVMSENGYYNYLMLKVYPHRKSGGMFDGLDEALEGLDDAFEAFDSYGSKRKSKEKLYIYKLVSADQDKLVYERSVLSNQIKEQQDELKNDLPIYSKNLQDTLNKTDEVKDKDTEFRSKYFDWEGRWNRNDKIRKVIKQLPEEQMEQVENLLSEKVLTRPEAYMVVTGKTMEQFKKEYERISGESIDTNGEMPTRTIPDVDTNREGVDSSVETGPANYDNQELGLDPSDGIGATPGEAREIGDAMRAGIDLGRMSADDITEYGKALQQYGEALKKIEELKNKYPLEGDELDEALCKE